jgi:hypothetical protein
MVIPAVTLLYQYVHIPRSSIFSVALRRMKIENMLKWQKDVFGRLLVTLVGANLHAFVTLPRLASTDSLGCRSLMPFVLDSVRIQMVIKGDCIPR